MCTLLSVSRRGCYAWLKRQPSQRKKEAKVLNEGILALPVASRKTYGVRRIRVDLQAEQRHCGRDRIAKLLKRLGIKAADNQVWAGDISYIFTQTGFLDLATVIDFYSRLLVGWSLSRSLKTPLIIDILVMGRTRRLPPIGVVIHADRGNLYASANYQKQIINPIYFVLEDKK